MTPLLQLLIRRFEPSDSYEELTELLHRGYAQLATSGLRYHAGYQTAEVTRRRCEGGECYVAECAGRIVATILFKPPGKCGGAACYEDPTVASFEQFAVLPELQGHGIGRRLLGFVEKLAADRSARAIVIDTSEQAHELISMYGRRGYRAIDTVCWEVTNYTSVILRKDLPNVTHR